MTKKRSVCSFPPPLLRGSRKLVVSIKVMFFPLTPHPRRWELVLPLLFGTWPFSCHLERTAKKAILEDIIAVEISKDADIKGVVVDAEENPIAAAAAAKKQKGSHAMQQKIFGKTIVFTQTKREADELVSGGVFKSLTAQVRK